MAPLESMLQNYFSEPSTSKGYLSYPLTKGEPAIPKLSFDGLLSQELDLPSSKLPFVWKLYEMLEGVDRSGEEHIVSWVESGRAFKVHKLEEFVQNIVPIYFKQSKYKSFQRQLNFYDFTRITSGPNSGAYYHPEFLEGSKTLCLSIRPKATKRRKASIKKTEAQARSNKSGQWMAQIQNVLVNGADHGMQQQHAKPTVKHSVASTRRPSTPEKEDFRDGDMVFIFEGMQFHFLSL
jgi:hypothetical protein